MPTKKSEPVNVTRIAVTVFAVAFLVIVGAVVYVKKPWNLIASLGKQSIILETDITKTKEFTVDEKGGTVHFYDAQQVLISVDIPPDAVPKKQSFSLLAIKKGNDGTDTGVSLHPEGYKFKKPISISFDFSKSSLKNDAPETLINGKVRETGPSHVYLYSKETKDLTPILVARGVESASYLSSRTLFTGMYAVRLHDRDAVTLARKALDQRATYFYSAIEAATTLLYNGHSLTADQKKIVLSAVEKITAKKDPPLYELYAALVVKKKLEVSSGFFPVVFAADTSLSSQLQGLCSKTTHSLESYIVASLLAEMNGLTAIASECKQQLNAVIPMKVAAIIADSQASFEAVVTLLTQIKAIEGDNSPRVAQLQKKLEEVVARDAQNSLTGTQRDRDEAIAQMDFASVDPALRSKLEAVQATDVQKEIDKLLSTACQTPDELKWAKVLATQYSLTRLIEDIDKRIAENKECAKDVGGTKDPKTPPNPPPPGNGSPAPTKAPDECYWIHQYNWHYDGQTSCKFCYEVMTNDNLHKTLYEDCDVATGEETCQSLLRALETRECNYEGTGGGPTLGGDSEDPPIVPPDYGEDPQLVDPNTGEETQDDAPPPEDLPLEDPNDYLPLE